MLMIIIRFNSGRWTGRIVQGGGELTVGQCRARTTIHVGDVE